MLARKLYKLVLTFSVAAVPVQLLHSNALSDIPYAGDEEESSDEESLESGARDPGVPSSGILNHPNTEHLKMGWISYSHFRSADGVTGAPIRDVRVTQRVAQYLVEAYVEHSAWIDENIIAGFNITLDQSGQLIVAGDSPGEIRGDVMEAWKQKLSGDSEVVDFFNSANQQAPAGSDFVLRMIFTIAR